jgi:Ribbon-helix-helix protein, copG family
MGHTLSIRINDDLDAWIEETAQKRGISKGKLIRNQLELGRKRAGERAFMRLAGAVSGPKDLSARKGFSKR